MTASMIPWTVVAILLLLLYLPESNGGKTDLLSRIMALFGLRSVKTLEDMEKDAGLTRKDGYDPELDRIRMERLIHNKNKDNSNAG